MLSNLRFNRVLHEVNVLLAIRTSDGPQVHGKDRFEITDLGEGFWQIVLTYGFMDDPNVIADLTKLNDRTLKITGLQTAEAKE